MRPDRQIPELIGRTILDARYDEEGIVISLDDGNDLWFDVVDDFIEYAVISALDS